MPNPESVQENETPEIRKDFRIQTDHLISARWPDLVIVNKKNGKLDFADLSDDRVKLKEGEKGNK